MGTTSSARVPTITMWLVVASAGCSNAEPPASSVAAPLAGAIEATECEFPSVVQVQLASGYCSGTLVHPEAIVTAAHCGRVRSVSFGESASRRTVAVTECFTHPTFATWRDWDFQICRLAERVDDVPIVPLLSECESSVLTVNEHPVVVVGFGPTTSGGSGGRRKRHATMGIDPSVRWGGPVITIGANYPDDPAFCPGDSGGPTFVQLSDGTFRQLGLHRTGSCTSGGQDSLVHRALDFFESSTGLDLTPCHDDDGTWNPDPGCGGFPTTLTAGGTWPSCGAPPPGPTPSSLCDFPALDGGIASDAGVASPVDSGTPPVLGDAGGPSVSDGGSVTPLDAGEPSVSDGGSVTPLDAGVETPLDAGTMSAADAGDPEDLSMRGGCSVTAPFGRACRLPLCFLAAVCLGAWRRTQRHRQR